MKRALIISLSGIAVLVVVGLVLAAVGVFLLPDGTTDLGVDVAEASENPYNEISTLAEIGTADKDGYLPSAKMTINWNAVKKTTPNVAGWIYCPSTAINMPIVKYDSLSDVPKEETAFYVIGDDDAHLKNENTVIYAPNMNFDAFTSDDFVFGNTLRNSFAICTVDGERYDGFLWGISEETEKFGQFDVEKRNFKNLFEKQDWIEAAVDNLYVPDGEELEDSGEPEDIEPLLTIIGTGGTGKTLLLTVYPNDIVD